MPTSIEILHNLKFITNNYIAFAIIWHILIWILLFTLFLKWKPTNNLMIVLMSLPLFSVSIFAWVAGNPFNGIIFLILAVSIFIIGYKSKKETVTLSTMPFFIIGILLIVFGLIYPHFLETDLLIRYLIAAPSGLIPCPTLSFILGFTLIYNGFKSKVLSVVLIIAGLFYGLFGIFKLKVFLDAILLAGILIFIIQYFLKIKEIGK